ncbi:hypothetical protein [Rhizobium mongolense]
MREELETGIGQMPAQKSIGQLYSELAELTSTSADEPHVGVYKRAATGEINRIAGCCLSDYGGILPALADILSIIGSDGYNQFVVKQRMHIGTPERQGWALIVEPIEDSFLAALPENWVFDADTFDQSFEDLAEEIREEIAEADRHEEEKHIAAERAKAERREARLAAKAKRIERREAMRQAKARTGEGE